VIPAPVGPVDPVSVEEPGTPWGPVYPVGPKAPLDPVGPVSPTGAVMLYDGPVGLPVVGLTACVKSVYCGVPYVPVEKSRHPLPDGPIFTNVEEDPRGV
jgi:hypothetical protein